MGDPGAFFEIISPDAAGARPFYTGLFGRAADANPAFGGYALVDTKSGESAIGGGIGGGIGEADEAGEADEPGEAGVKIYMRGGNRAACLERAAKLGGTVAQPPHDRPGDAGRTALFTGPDGNTAGLWE